jgi:hypothetical protein
VVAVTDYVFRCDYCGEYTPLHRAVEAYVADQELPDGRVTVLPSMHCGTYCAEQSMLTRAGTPGG